MHKSSVQPKYGFILHVYSPQKPAENPIMDNYVHTVMTPHPKQYCHILEMQLDSLFLAVKEEQR